MNFLSGFSGMFGKEKKPVPPSESAENLHDTPLPTIDETKADAPFTRDFVIHDDNLGEKYSKEAAMGATDRGLLSEIKLEGETPLPENPDPHDETDANEALADSIKH